MNNFNWKIINSSKTSNARTGIISTPHGLIYTPAFIFCGTKAALKSVKAEEAKENGTQIILSNTYHLMLQPGSNIIAKHGGLHKFMNWKGPMLTDSGGFQIFSLGHGSVSEEIKGKGSKIVKKSLLKIFEEGALFKSYIDGSNHLLTPERSINIQRNIGADIILVFDECTPYNVNKDYTAASMERSHRWSLRSLKAFESKIEYDSFKGSAGNQVLYGIVQGGIHLDLREESIDFNLKEKNFFGLAIGGSLGATKNQMYDIVKYTASRLNKKNPIHLLGIGDPDDIWNGVEYGVDTFDCVSPTRLARHGSALIKNNPGKISLRNARYKNEIYPIDEKCFCSTCKNYSKSYLHHLFKAEELLAYQLITIHNIYFMNDLMSFIRNAINNNNFQNAKKEWYSN